VDRAQRVASAQVVLVLVVQDLAVPVRASARLVTPEDAMMGVAKLALVSTVRVLVVLAALTAYFLLARTAFVPFAIALVVTFLVTLGYEAFKASSATRRSTRTG
jgi:hypothetical protein